MIHCSYSDTQVHTIQHPEHKSSLQHATPEHKARLQHATPRTHDSLQLFRYSTQVNFMQHRNTSRDYNMLHPEHQNSPQIFGHPIQVHTTQHPEHQKTYCRYSEDPGPVKRLAKEMVVVVMGELMLRSKGIMILVTVPSGSRYTLPSLVGRPLLATNITLQS